MNQVEAYLDAIVRAAAAGTAATARYRDGDLETKARIALAAVDGRITEIGQLRGGSVMTPELLHAATDTVLEELERAAGKIIAGLPLARRKPMTKRLVAFVGAWRSFLGMSSERAAFQAATNVVKEIRRRSITVAVALDRWRNLEGVKITSNAAANDIDVLIQAVCEVGGQDDIRCCRRYVEEHGETFKEDAGL